jgi:general secretion pathway protein F
MQFKLKVYRAPEGVTLLEIAASDVSAATVQAQQQGFRVISAHRQWRCVPRSPGGAFSVALFSQELVALLDAGLSLVETIDILARKSRQHDTQRVLQALGSHLREGLSFSRALETMPEAFPTLYLATIRTSERTGNLVEALKRYLAHHRQLNLVRDKVVAASVYPALLMAVGAIVVLFLLGYVVPRFSLVYQDLGHNLPWMSRVLMKWGQFISYNGWQMAAGVALFIGGAAFALTRPVVGAKLVRALWSIPAVGEKLRIYQLARFTRTLAMLVNGGIPFVTALELVRDLLRQPALRLGLLQAATAIREGRSVSESFAANGLATEVGVRLLGVGERSGELGQAMERIATLYDDEITRWVDWFTRLFEPVLMIVIGLAIGLIVVLMYMPIFELANTIQ